MTDDDIRHFLEHDCERVVRVVTVVCGDRGRAEDAVQEALVDVWTRRRQVNDLSRWVTTAAINRARSRWRSLAAERRAYRRLSAREPEPAMSYQSSFDQQLANALASLPRGQREVVALHYLLDLSISDIGSYLGVADGTVKTHLHRGRTNLRSALQPTKTQGADSDVRT